MWKSILKQLLFFLLALMTLMTACSISTPVENRADNRTPLPTAASLPAATIPVAISTPEPLPTVTPMPESTLTITSMPTASPTPSIVQRVGCPTLLSNLSPYVWLNGSILFNTGRIFESALWWPQVEQDGIWAISANGSEPQLAYQPTKYVVVSPDGNTLASFKPVSEGSVPIMSLYSMITRELVEIIMPPITGSSVTEPYLRWLPNASITRATLLERNLGSGEVWNVVIVNPATQEVEHFTLELNLPDYDFFEYDVKRGIPSGFVAVDPSYQRVLYTAARGKNQEIRLLDLATGEILWEAHSEYLINTFPQWTQDGQRVLFEVAMLRKDIPPNASGDQYITFAWSKLVSLNRDGQEEELPIQPFPGLLEQLPSNFSRSPDERYIFYSFYEFGMGRNRAYVVDTVTGEIGEICDPQSSFVSGLYDFVEVHWLPDGQLVYRVLVEKNGQPAHVLRVLDIPSWAAQTVFEAEPGYGVNIFGWTPVEVP